MGVMPASTTANLGPKAAIHKEKGKSFRGTTKPKCQTGHKGIFEANQ